KFPVTQRWSWQRKFRTLRGRLRCRSARETNRNKIDVFQKAAVGHCDVAGDCRSRKRACYFYVCIRPCCERIVSRHQHALGSELQIESRFGQSGKRHATGHSERAAGQIAPEAVQGKRILCEGYARIKT